MKPTSANDELVELFRSLSAIPLKYKDRQVSSPQCIAQLGRKALNSHACTLALVNLERRETTLAAWSGSGEKHPRHVAGRVFALGSLRRERSSITICSPGRNRRLSAT